MKNNIAVPKYIIYILLFIILLLLLIIHYYTISNELTTISQIVTALMAIATFILYFFAMRRQNEIIENELYMPARQKHSEDIIENVIEKLKYIIKDDISFFGNINQFNLNKNLKDFLCGGKLLNFKNYCIETLFNDYEFNNNLYNFLQGYYYLKNKENPPIPTNSYNLYIDFIKNHQPEKIDVYNKENIDLDKALKGLINADIEFSKKIIEVQYDFRRKLNKKFKEYKTANLDIYNSACGDINLLCDNHKTFPLFKVLYDYWMKMLCSDYIFSLPIKNLENKSQLTETFLLNKSCNGVADSYVIYFVPPEKDYGITSYISTVYKNKQALEEFLSSVKEFVNEIPDDHLRVQGDALQALKREVEDGKRKVNNILDILGKKVIFPGDCDYIK